VQFTADRLSLFPGLLACWSEKIVRKGEGITYESETSSAGYWLDFQVTERPADDGLHLASEKSHATWRDGPFLVQHLRQCYPKLRGKLVNQCRLRLYQRNGAFGKNSWPQRFG